VRERRGLARTAASAPADEDDSAPVDEEEAAPPDQEPKKAPSQQDEQLHRALEVLKARVAKG